MNLILDIGNTRGKYAIFDGDTLLARGDNPTDWRDPVAAHRRPGEPLNILLAATGTPPAGLREQLQAAATLYREASATLPLPIPLDYDTPATLGIDRVAAAIAAIALHPGRPLLVIDAGTAITFNFVSADGRFLGGNISPGARLRYLALHHFTARLPLLDGAPSPGDAGKNTPDAIRQGVTRGIILETRGYIADFRLRHPAGITLLTGGDSPWIAPALGQETHLEQNLVLTGLNKILEHQKTSGT
ncbi:MAG: type III pantothenate kinase [Odoribacteraceae bacterium]|jgi:type III pantothenate kinase|nr:type III pantothenate kinase [Odoribacteraceae bacterium]